jgi:choline kinase
VTTVVISAAGLGTRLGMNMPKCLLPLHEGRLIDYQLALLPPGADVRIVVGFKETEVIDHVCRHWPDVTFVRNPNFATTSNSYSLHLATRWLKKPFIAIDGDLLIDPVAFRRFWDYCQTADPPTTIGIVPRASEASTHEWCGIAYFNGLSVEPNQKYVFEELARYLPLPSFEIRCCEIDTPKDLEHAMQVFSSMTQPLPWMRATA